MLIKLFIKVLVDDFKVINYAVYISLHNDLQVQLNHFSVIESLANSIPNGKIIIYGVLPIY